MLDRRTCGFVGEHALAHDRHFSFLSYVLFVYFPAVDMVYLVLVVINRLLHSMGPCPCI